MESDKTEPLRRFSEGLKLRIVKDVESGKLSIAEASREYETSKQSVKSWLSEYGRFRAQRSIVEVVMKDETAKIEELQKALAEAHLKIRIYDKIMEIAKKKYKIDLKKNYGPQASELLSGKAVESK
jgi:transposase